MALVFGICCSVFGDGITTVEANGKQYTNVYDVHIGTDGRVVIFSSNGATIASADKLPVDFLKSWNINSEDAKATEARKTADDLERAINSGCFREIDGVVYDTRKPQSGWTNFRKAKVIQVLDDGIILDITPDSSDYFPAHVKNLSSSIGDTDTISFVAKLTGNYSYINKNGDDRTIREYDAGQPCSRDEIPDSVLSGNKTFDVAVQSGSPSRDVVASLPESDDLQANGSGFFITEDGYLITNFHVVKDAKKVKVKNSSGIFPAEVVHVDKDNDLALLKVSGQFKPLHISNDDAELGEAAFTIGFPDIVLQGTDPKYTDGKISSLDGIKDDPKDYQISVQVQPGNSGGPLVDMSGNVIGIIVARLNDMAALSSSGGLPQNVNYAIKSKYLNDFLGQFPEIKLNSIKSTSSEGVVQSTQQSVAMVLVY
jgi:S1-C subfamily serine protease